MFYTFQKFSGLIYLRNSFRFCVRKLCRQDGYLYVEVFRVVYENIRHRTVSRSAAGRRSRAWGRIRIFAGWFLFAKISLAAIINMTYCCRVEFAMIWTEREKL